MSIQSWITGEIQKRINKVTSISHYWQAECGTPISSILEVLPKAAWKPLVGFIIPSMGEIERNAIRPRGMKGPVKLGRKKRFYNRPLIPDVGEHVGKIVGDVTGLKARPPIPGEALVWLGVDLFERVLYEIMVFDLILDTWYNAILALKRQGYCKAIGALQGGGDYIWSLDSNLFGQREWLLTGGHAHMIIPGTQTQHNLRFGFTAEIENHTDHELVHTVILGWNDFNGEHFDKRETISTPPGAIGIVQLDATDKARSIDTPFIVVGAQQHLPVIGTGKTTIYMACAAIAAHPRT